MAKTGGRTKGTPNRENKALREMILGALDELGGQDYLVEQGRANPGTFLMLIAKVLPTTLAGDPNAPLALSVMSEEERQRQVRASPCRSPLDLHRTRNARRPIFSAGYRPNPGPGFPPARPWGPNARAGSWNGKDAEISVVKSMT